MKGDKKVIDYLNKALGNELVAINQYFLHAKMYKDWGLKSLAEKEYEESIDEMKHAKRIHRLATTVTRCRCARIITTTPRRRSHVAATPAGQ